MDKRDDNCAVVSGKEYLSLNEMNYSRNNNTTFDITSIYCQLEHLVINRSKIQHRLDLFREKNESHVKIVLLLLSPDREDGFLILLGYLSVDFQERSFMVKNLSPLPLQPQKQVLPQMLSHHQHMCAPVFIMGRTTMGSDNFEIDEQLTLGKIFFLIDKIFQRMKLLSQLADVPPPPPQLEQTLNTYNEEKHAQLYLILMVANRDDHYKVIKKQFEKMYRDYNKVYPDFLNHVQKLHPQYSYCTHIDTLISSSLHEMDYVKNTYYQLYYDYDAEYLFCLPSNIVHGFDLLYEKILKNHFSK